MFRVAYNTMNIAVVGSRNFNNYELLASVLNNFQIAKIISGGARGADALAESYAYHKNIPLEIFKADWKTYGRAAGPIRNKQIVMAADYVVAFWDQHSPGTRSTLKFAKQQNKPYLIIPF